MADMNISKVNDFAIVKQNVLIDRYLADRGIEIRSNNRFNAVWRDGDSFSCSFDGNRTKWFDHKDKVGGSVLDLCMKVEGLGNVKQAASVLCECYHLSPMSGNRSASWREVAQYNYTDTNGVPLYCKVRYEREKNGRREKLIPYYRLNKDGTRGAKGKGDIPHVLYRLPGLIEGVKTGASIFVAEGEKDVDNLNALGLVATSSKELGNKKNSKRFAQFFRGAKRVLIIADHDDEQEGTGQQIAVTVRDALSKAEVLSSIAYVESGKDASDWIEAMRKDGLTDDAIKQKFLELADNPPEWKWEPQCAHSNNSDALPPRFGELALNSTNAEYPTFVGKIKMPDENYYSFEVSAANDTLYAAILRSKKSVANAYTNAHIGKSNFPGLKSKDLVDVQPICVAMWLRSCGCFYRNSETRKIEDLMYFNRKSGRLLRMDSDEFSSWVSNGARVNRADKEFQRLTAFLQDAAMDANVSVEMMPKAFVARSADAVYISNGESNIVRCKDGKCELVRNGVDGILFPCEYTLKKWRLLPDKTTVRDPFKTTAQFRDLAYTTWYAQYLLRAWYLNLFACHSNHTPLLLTGERNSGKSATARGLREMAGFPKREAGIDPKKEEDFWVSVNGKGILFFDNIEEEAMQAKWLNSAIEKVTTGGGKEVRKLYTHGSTNYEATSDIIFASKIPYYAANEGVAHRFVIVNLNASIATYKGDGLMKEILDQRDESMTWTARTIAKALVAKVQTPPNVNERYPDFGDFTLRCAEALGDYEKVLNALQCGELEKSRIVLANDPDAKDVYRFLLNHDGKWEGELMEVAKWANADALPNDDAEKVEMFLRKKTMRYGHAIRRLLKPFEACFKSVDMRTRQGRTRYEFGGLNDHLKGNP